MQNAEKDSPRAERIGSDPGHHLPPLRSNYQLLTSNQSFSQMTHSKLCHQSLSKHFVEVPLKNGLFRQSFPTKDSDKVSATLPLGQTLVRGQTSDLRPFITGHTRTRTHSTRPNTHFACHALERAASQLRVHCVKVRVQTPTDRPTEFPLEVLRPFPVALVR
jgi:hypothetical protein